VPYAPTNWSGVHVLIVDDNGINRRLAEIILHQHNAQVVTASSGESAIKLVEKHAFDIIFMDLHMPGLDGYATTKRIRQLQAQPEPVIIALTANAMPAERVRIYESGMNDIMIKPISEQIMNAVILRWLNNSGDTKSDIDSEIFSIEEAEKFTAGNAILAIELTNMLKIELPEYQQKIALALETQNYAELKVQVHKLHGASRCCGTPALREAAEYLERVIDSEQYDELTTATIRLRREITRLLDYPIKPL
jgi:two-component system sensor histidine kinase BarA